MHRRLMNTDTLAFVAEYCKVLGEPLRLKILNCLKGGEKSVTEITAQIKSSQPNVSKHLHLLKQTGFVYRRQVKNTALFSIADERIWQICELACRDPDR